MSEACDRAAVSVTAVRQAAEAGRRYLLARQDPAGYWHFDQPTRVEAAAEDLLFRQFTGLREPGLVAGTARWLRSRQRPDGGWAARAGRGGDPSASVLAYCALRVAGDSADAYHMALAAGWIRDAGGLPAAGTRARVWLAMFGQVRWEELRVPPPEAAYLPAAYPALMPGQPGWGRPLLLPLAVIGALRPARQLPFGLSELQVPAEDHAVPRRPPSQGGLVAGPAGGERHAWIGTARAVAVRRCVTSIIGGQLPDGSWLADGPGWHLSLIALHLLGHSFEDSVLARGLASLNARSVWTDTEQGPARWLDIGSPAAHGSAQAVLALSAAGLPAADEALVRAAGWLLGQERANRTAWRAGQREGSPVAARDCASLLLALGLVPLPAEARQRQACVCAAAWLTSLQGRDGGWARVSGLPLTARRDDRGAVCAELTGHVLAALAAAGQPGSAAIRRAVVCLLRLQLPGGSWPGDASAADHHAGDHRASNHGASDHGATCSVLPALVAAGVLPTKAPVWQAARWVARQQHPGGGWADTAMAGQAGAGPAPAPTAAAVLALLAAGRTDSEAAIERGVAWLTRVQLADGSWDQPGADDTVTGPLRALGSYLATVASRAVPTARTAAQARSGAG